MLRRRGWLCEPRRYLPNTSTLARFLWVVGFLARNDFIVQVVTPDAPSMIGLD